MGEMEELTERQPASQRTASTLGQGEAQSWASEPGRLGWAALRAWLSDAGAELLVIVLWTLLIAAPYANLSPRTAPHGIEYYILIQSNHVWTRFEQCGWCALWNGSVRGGAPAFVDPHASLLHPLVIVTTLLFGVIVGSKVALVCAFFLAGLAQWWLARVLGLGRGARIWSAAMAVAAGFLAAQMSEGLFSMVISAVSCALVLPPLVWLAQTGRRRAAVAFGGALALALVSGQGYMQIGLALLLPAAALLPRRARMGWGALLRRYALAGALALLLAAPFLVPFAHFLPEFRKNADPDLAGAQPFTYVLFNLVIGDHDVYTTSALGKLPYPFLYANFIGWVPVLLAIYGLPGGAGPRERRVKIFLATFALGALWLASGAALRWVAHLPALPWLAGQAASVRNCSLIAGLAIPPILALAGLGLERLLDAPWLQLDLVIGRDVPPRDIPIDLRWLLVFPLTLALLQAHSFGKGWIATDSVPVAADPAITALRTPTVQWVNTPIGDNPWEERAVSSGLKLAYGFRAWDWKGRKLPPAALVLSHHTDLPDLRMQRPVIDGVYLYAAPGDPQYAALTTDSGERVACAAHGAGGTLDIVCDSPRPGVLALAENSWSGWRAQIDGRPAALRPAPVLSVELPAGRHTVSLRYQPWDVPLGLGLCLLGLALALYHWRRDD